jgi:predicted HAD superfamily Cof-like phosphohydrolase
MDTNQQKVLNFHQTFGALINEKPTEISVEEAILRLRLIHEEFGELIYASGLQHNNEWVYSGSEEWGVRTQPVLNSDGTVLIKKCEDKHGTFDMPVFEEIYRPNLPLIADALGDLLYVIYGTAIAYGIDMESVFNEIHRSNMSKANPDGSVNKREDGKIIKSASYSPARIKEIIALQQHKCCATCENCNKEFSGYDEKPYLCGLHFYCPVADNHCCNRWKLDEGAFVTAMEE